MLVEHKSAFAYSTADLPGYSGSPFRIHLTTTSPIIDRPRRHSPKEQAVMYEKGEDLLRNGIARRVDTANEDIPCISNLVLPVKKGRGW